MLFLSPVIFPLILGGMGFVLFVQTYESNVFLGISLLFAPLLYYAIVLVVSIFIVRYITERLRRRLVEKTFKIL